MSSSTDLRPHRPEATGITDQGNGGKPPSRDYRRLALRVAITLSLTCALVAVYPALASPLTGDNQYEYIRAVGQNDGSIIELFRSFVESAPERITRGRINILTEFERNSVGIGLTNLSVATATPVEVYSAILKMALLTGGILTVVAFVRSLRWRAADGSLVRASRTTLIVIGILGTLAVAVGTQTHSPYRNGWVSYPVNTYGAVISIFGVVALTLWLSRLVAERSSRAMTVFAIIVLAVIGIATNFRYELVFPGIILAGIALLVVPVTDQAHRRAGRRAKWITGTALLGTFIPLLIANRVYLANVCQIRECYVAVRPQLGLESVKVAIYNFFSPIPGMAGNELRRTLEQAGWEDRLPVPVPWWSILVGVLVGATVLALWWSLRPSSPDPADLVTTEVRSRRVAEAQLLVIGALLALLAAAGAAAVMSLSARSLREITEFGEPYRSTMVGWTALAFAGVMLIAAVGLIWPRRAAIAWGAAAVVMGATVATTLPDNLMALNAERQTFGLTSAINWEVAKGDTSEANDARRCELYGRIEQEIDRSYIKNPLHKWTNPVYELYHGEPFCAE